MSDLTVWIVDDAPSIRWVLERALAEAGITVRSFPGGAEVLDALDAQHPDVLMTDIRMAGIDGLTLAQRIRHAVPTLPVIIMTAYSDLDSAVAAYQGGVFEYLPKPFDVDAAVDLVHKAARVNAAAASPAPDAAVNLSDEPGMIGEAPAMQTVFRAIGRLSASHIAVMITGESGTGKELVARALHRHSPRCERPFVAVNTAAVPGELLESEFFGHEKGAFTGAQTQRRGCFEQAHGGTLFLDEIGDMSPALQTRLLRVLQDGQFYRVGGHQPITVDVRVIAATNQDLEAAVARGDFREDLYYRLDVVRIRVPAVRERPEDIPLLLAHCLDRAAAELAVGAKTLTPEATDCLAQGAWPGNVRQLDNLCRWLTVMAPGPEVAVADLPAKYRTAKPSREHEAARAEDAWDSVLERWSQRRLAAGGERLADEALSRFEQALIRAALAHTHGRRQDAARLLGWGRNTLTRKLKAWQMDAY